MKVAMVTTTTTTTMGQRRIITTTVHFSRNNKCWWILMTVGCLVAVVFATLQTNAWRQQQQGLINNLQKDGGGTWQQQKKQQQQVQQVVDDVWTTKNSTTTGMGVAAGGIDSDAEDDDDTVIRGSGKIASKLPTMQNTTTGIVHVIRTRFMQHQPSLIQLGKARLKLFESIYLRSLQRQSSLAFVCMIRTDPDLDPTLREGLISALQASGIPHLLVASNDEPKSYFDDIMIQNNVQSHQVWSGSLSDVKIYLQGPREPKGPPHVLETRLDADDGLDKDFVKTLQDEVKQNFKFAPETWKLWCIGKYSEWQANLNFAQSNTNHQMDDPSMADPGKIIVRPEKEVCVTPGMSIAFLGESKSIEVSRGTGVHFMAFRDYGLCSQSSTPDGNCIHILQLQMAAVRARTPTSAGMKDVMIDGEIQNRVYQQMITEAEERQHRLWKKQANQFGFTMKDGKDINAFFYKNLKSVATEALEGQCTKGHSCKKSSQEQLQKIVAALP